MKISTLAAIGAMTAFIMSVSSSAIAGIEFGNTSVSGKIYANATSITAKDAAGNKTSASGSGIDIKRFYTVIDHKFNDTWAGNITSDVTVIDGVADGFIKKAYVEAKVSPALKVRVGSSDTPWIPYAESIYGYRYFEKTVVDQQKYGTSADWGVHVGGQINPIFAYQVSVINGAGYRKLKRTKTMDIEGRLSAKINQWNFAVGGYSGKLGNQVQGGVDYRTASRVDLLAAYSGDRIRIGVEYFAARNWKVKASAAADKAEGISLFGAYKVSPNYAVFARVDETKPNTSTHPVNKTTSYNVGVSYTALKNINISVGAKHLDVKTSAGTARTDEIGVWTELRY